MNYDEKPLGFECYLNGLGRVSLSQDQTHSAMCDVVKIPTLSFQPQELPALIDRLMRVIADEVIPDLRSQNEENEALIHLLHHYLPQERPAKKRGPPAAD